ncbi:hypothetical protein OAQ78_07450, partial [Amylibacter sp.]|nr:hypothetical protein [Amylibacter sp.]
MSATASFALPPCPASGYFNNCFGTYTFADGEKYVGEWKDDEKNGQGTFTFADERKYVGKWKNNEFNGQGTYTYANGSTEEGIWKDSELLYAQKRSPPAPVARTTTQDDEI